MSSDGDVKLQGYTDSDWAGSAVDQRVLLDVASVWDQCDLMVEQEADISGTQYNRGRVYSSQYCKP
jgi:hypothetical protein